MIASDLTHAERSQQYGNYQYEDRDIYKDDWYHIKNGCSRMQQETVVNYEGKDSAYTSTVYEYGNKAHMLPTKITTAKSDGGNVVIENKYPQDLPGAGDLLVNNNMVATILESYLKDGAVTQFTKRKYKSNNLFPVLEYVSQNSAKNNAEENRVNVSVYNNYNRPEEIINDGKYTVILWGYNAQYPVAVIEGINYNTAVRILNTTEKNAVKEGNAHSGNILNVVRNNNPDALVTTYTYKPLVGVTSVTDPAGVVTTYEYDGFGRLLQIKDKNGKILEKYKYKFKR